MILHNYSDHDALKGFQLILHKLFQLTIDVKRQDGSRRNHRADVLDLHG